MRMWEIRDYSDYSKKRGGYNSRMGHRDPEEEAYECGYEDGYRDAMKEAKSYYERQDDDRSEYQERRMKGSR